MNKGYIYVLSNESFDGIVKIGKTTRTPEKRANELMTTGVPSPFNVEFAIYVEDCDAIEIAIHEYLADRRVNNDREFFKMEIFNAIGIVTKIALSDIGISVMEEHVAIEPSDVWDAHCRTGIELPDIKLTFRFIEKDAWICAMENLNIWRDENKQCT